MNNTSLSARCLSGTMHGRGSLVQSARAGLSPLSVIPPSISFQCEGRFSAQAGIQSRCQELSFPTLWN